MYKFIWEWIGTFIMYQEFPGGSDSKESSCNMGDLGLIPGLGRSTGEGHGNPLLYSCLENLQGQRGLAGYIPWGGKESDTTEWLSTHDILNSRVHQHIISLFSLKWFFTCFAIQPFPSSQLYKLINNLSEKAMVPHSSTLAWKIPWAEEPGRLQSMGSLRVRHDWATSLAPFTFMHWRRKWQPTPVFLPGESQGRGSLVGCCLWGRTESDTTEAT